MYTSTLRTNVQYAINQTAIANIVNGSNSFHSIYCRKKIDFYFIAMLYPEKISFSLVNILYGKWIDIQLVFYPDE